MKENKDIENLLLDDSAYNKLVTTKIEQEFKKDLEQVKSKKKQEEIFDIKEVPENKLFSKSAVFEILNKNSKTKSYISGVQAEGFLGTQYSTRKKLLNGEIESFFSGNNYIKFVKVKV